MFRSICTTYTIALFLVTLQESDTDDEAHLQFARKKSFVAASTWVDLFLRTVCLNLEWVFYERQGPSESIKENSRWD